MERVANDELPKRLLPDLCHIIGAVINRSADFASLPFGSRELDESVQRRGDLVASESGGGEGEDRRSGFVFGSELGKGNEGG